MIKRDCNNNISSGDASISCAILNGDDEITGVAVKDSHDNDFSGKGAEQCESDDSAHNNNYDGNQKSQVSDI